MPVFTVAAECRRLGLEHQKALSPHAPAVRYERDRPGELLHLVIKRLDRIGRVGHRIHGDRTKRVRGIGREYLHICLHGAGRVAYAELLADRQVAGERMIKTRPRRLGCCSRAPLARDTSGCFQVNDACSQTNLVP